MNPRGDTDIRDTNIKILIARARMEVHHLFPPPHHLHPLLLRCTTQHRKKNGKHIIKRVRIKRICIPPLRAREMHFLWVCPCIRMTMPNIIHRKQIARTMHSVVKAQLNSFVFFLFFSISFIKKGESFECNQIDFHIECNRMKMVLIKF